MASFHTVLVVLHENGKSSVSSSSAELRFTVVYESALLQRRTFSFRVSCNAHGGLEPRQTVLENKYERTYYGQQHSAGASFLKDVRVCTPGQTVQIRMTLTEIRFAKHKAFNSEL